MAKERPSPEKFLRRAIDEERQTQRGKFKIYFGAAPGVGKTYTMLQDAAVKRAQGLDVVAGIVESHGRQEVKALLKQFEELPRKEIIYRDKKILEFDLDAALKRNPALILIDEMAHTNAPGSRHQKRWQDIKEILDRGINVCATVNVQHIESINDDIAQIIGTEVKETVPDSMLELADTIELIDLPAEDLLKRLQEGKVYIPEQAELATEHFFQKDKLTALRELALRVTAERVGAQVLLYRQGEAVKSIWPSREKILVCVSSDVASLHLIRTARRIAGNLRTEWMAIHIETPKLKLSKEARNRAIAYLQLAEQLGAETHILTGFDMIKEIMNFAHEYNITQIVIGKKVHSRWRNLLFKNLADEVVRHSGEIDVYVVTGKAESTSTKKQVEERDISLKTYAFSLGIVTLATLVNCLLFPFLSSSNLIMVYLLGVIIVALFARIGPSILASILSVLAYDFFFVPPFYSFAVSDIQYFFTLLVMLIVAQVISNLTILTRRQAHASYFIEHQTAILHNLSRKLAKTRGINKLLEMSTQFLSETFHCEVAALLPQNSHLVLQSHYQTKIFLDDKELSIAQWVFEMGQKAGFGTHTLSYSKALYLPLFTSREVLGVIRVQPLQPDVLFSPEELRLLESCIQQIAFTLEADRLQKHDIKSELYAELEDERKRLCQDIAHLQIPIKKCIQSIDTLLEDEEKLKTDQVIKISREFLKQLQQLNKLVDNYSLVDSDQHDKKTR